MKLWKLEKPNLEDELDELDVISMSSNIGLGIFLQHKIQKNNQCL